MNIFGPSNRIEPVTYVFTFHTNWIELVTYFVWSLTVGAWNHVNTPYKTAHKPSLQFSV